MEIKTNKVFHHLAKSKKRFIVEQGGTRSGKTYNILMWLISEGLRRQGITITITRKTYPSLRATAMRDFFEILNTLNLYNEAHHNKSEATYYLRGNLYEFISLDSPQKIRGRKRHIVFINEANEITLEDFFQLNMRTLERVIVDYNPSEDFWVYEEVIPREDCDFHITTYKDNPFLEPSLVREIERLKDQDEFYWKVYGLGEMAPIQGVVFSNWKVRAFEYEKEDSPAFKELQGYGLDFGFTNDPTALVEVRKQSGELWVRELIFEPGLTNQDIAERMDELGVDGDIVADSAEPKSIEEINRKGHSVRGAIKGQDSIRAGIDLLRQYNINIHPESVNLIREFKNYKYKQDPTGKYGTKVVDKFNHGIDALRYFVFTDMNNSGYGEYVFI